MSEKEEEGIAENHRLSKKACNNAGKGKTRRIRDFTL
jgi:hypothetical protein